jgi:large subunit ribosomal protein L21
MYAVVKTGGKQYKVTANSRIRVEKLDYEVGDSVELDSVQMLISDDKVVFDPADLKSARVVARVEEQGRGKKIRVYKKKRRKGYERVQGHRQSYTLLHIQEIKA